MKCPACTDTLLVMSERHGVEIDYCPQCRGVWLDRGELDKLLDRAALSAGTDRSAERRHSNRPEERHETSRPDYPHRRKHSSWLSEIFD